MTDPSVPPGHAAPSDGGAGAASPPAEPALGGGVDGPEVAPLSRLEPDPTASRRRRIPGWVPWVVGLMTVMLLGGAVAASAAVRVDEVLFSPGSVRSTADRVQISGATSYPIDGDVLFATVSVRQATLFDTLFRRPWDDTLRFTPIEEVYPDGDKEAVDAANESAMDDSKTVASVVALRHLGKEVTFTGDGVAIVDVSTDLPADGLLQSGDLLVGADGRRLQLTDDLHAALDDKEPGSEVTLSVIRGGAKPKDGNHSADASATDDDDEGRGGDAGGEEPKPGTEEESITVPLAAAEDGRAIMGVNVADYNLDVVLPMDITFDSGEVTGPSAGLAWTLAIIDELTPEDMTNGKRLAATGTIGPDGEVGAVGGLPQKTAAVRRSGAKLFLVPDGLPEGDLAEARELADGEVELVEVATLDEAVDAIEDFVGA